MSATEEVAALSAEVVQVSRKARFAGVSPEEWGERLTRLIAAQPDGGVAQVRDVRPIEAAAGGSNGTLLFTAAINGDEKDYVLRFAPDDGLFPVYDVAAQFNIQKALAKGGVPTPPQRWLDADGAMLGAPGYVMERVHGVSPPMAWKASGVIADAAPHARKAMIESMVETLAKVHAFDWRSGGLSFLEQRAPGARPIARECNWYWQAALWGKLDRETRLLASTLEWLIANEPALERPVLCHGDSNLGNYLFDGGAVTAVVDWEMAFIGAPECDLTFLIDGASVLQSGAPDLAGVPSDDDIRALYEQASGRALRDWDYYRLFSYFRVAIISALAQRHFPPVFKERYAPLHAEILHRTAEIASKLRAL